MVSADLTPDDRLEGAILTLSHFSTLSYLMAVYSQNRLSITPDQALPSVLLLK
jgi:hypothetical protein